MSCYILGTQLWIDMDTDNRVIKHKSFSFAFDLKPKRLAQSNRYKVTPSKVLNCLNWICKRHKGKLILQLQAC
jgi:hypothetical protein